jgi:hypothetical protein
MIANYDRPAASTGRTSCSAAARPGLDNRVQTAVTTTLRGVVVGVQLDAFCDCQERSCGRRG